MRENVRTDHLIRKGKVAKEETRLHGSGAFVRGARAEVGVRVQDRAPVVVHGRTNDLRVVAEVVGAPDERGMRHLHLLMVHDPCSG